MNKIKHSKISEISSTHKNEHGDYEYYRKKFIPYGGAKNTMVSIYEIPPLKSAYPYHYHYKNEETFYIISGQGILKTPDGEKNVSAGELIFFPANAEGAHKLTNCSETEPLVYIDFDVVHDMDVTIYPDSNKIGVWGMDINKLYHVDDDVDYYDNE